MKVINFIQCGLFLTLFLLANTGNAAGTDGKYSFTAPGIVAPSWPLFLDSNETIKLEKKGNGANAYWTLTGTGSTTSFWGGLSNSLDLGKDSVKYQANFNAAGELITSIGSKILNNYLEIKGSLPAGTFGNTSWTAQPNQLLLQATLLDSNATNGSPDLVGTYGGSALGFTTKFTGGWAANNIGLTGGSTGESLWLFASNSGFKNLVKALDGISGNGTLASLIGSSKTISGVSSVSAVPVPGAVWLFLFGLMTLLAGRRKSAGTRLAI